MVEAGTQVSLGIWAVVVEPGEYFISNASVVIFIAAADVREAVDTAEAKVARDAAMAKSPLAGTPISDVMCGTTKTCSRLGGAMFVTATPLANWSTPTCNVPAS